MASKEPHYSRINEAEKIIKSLCDKYPDVFWTVKPDMIIVMGIDNKTRSESQKKKVPYFTKLKAIKGAEKALLIDNNIPSRYIIETYWDEWNDWRESRKHIMLANEILKITADVGKTNAYDCTGFKILMKAFGVNWNISDDDLKDMLVCDIDFDLDLRPGLDTGDGDCEDATDDADDTDERDETQNNEDKEEVVEVVDEDSDDWKTMDGDEDQSAKDSDENPFE